VDQEAELSGSEYDSDENLDLADDEDIMEVRLNTRTLLSGYHDNCLKCSGGITSVGQFQCYVL